MSGPLTGTRHLVRLIGRRDRVRLPVWLGGITLMTLGSGNAVKTFYDTPEKIAGYVATVESSAAGVLINGEPRSVETIEGIIAYEVTTTAAVLACLMVIFLVVRHTRAEEESGRAELLRATATGRHAATAAAVGVAVAAAVLVGVLDAVVLIALDLGVTGALLHGAALTAIALSFAAVAVAAAQVTSSARAALGIAGGALGAAVVVRGIGDVGDNVLTWLSPFGWVQAVDPFGAQHLWPFLAIGAGFVALVALAAYLTTRRDAGSGLLNPRPGRPRAAAVLGTPLGLASRLQRALHLGWGSGLLAGALLFGSLGPELEGMLESNPELAEFFVMSGGDVMLSFFAFSLAFLGILATACAVSSVLRIRSEEAEGRAEAVLATGLSRTRWVGGILTVTVFGLAKNLLVIGAGLVLGNAIVGGGWESAGTIVASAFVLLPAGLLIAALGFVLVGWLPRWSGLAWVPMGFALLQSYLGEALRFPDWLSALSPFWHLPLVPAESFEALPVLVLAALAVVALGVGMVGLRRRDIG